MPATGDVEEQSVRGVNNHDRGKAFAPSCDLIERAGILFRLCLSDLQTRMNGARVSKRHAHTHA